VGRCGTGFLLLVGVHKNDTETDAVRLADRIAGLRILNDGDGKMNLALADVSGSVLAVSNFTVYGETKKNRRPSFAESASFDVGRALFDRFVTALRDKGIVVETGIFGAHMDVSLVNDGPVTVIVDVP
ncbi:MAG TPA: D-aminoacyl-tRNA deacylase, partial [Fimbriimonas sp.]|nr:D-aminoacyl-tRNA deacylase [Fimbriimonas sp.]